MDNLGTIPLAAYAPFGHIKRMRLLDHLKETGETVDAFSARIGVPYETIRKIVYGQRQPSLPLAVKIERATDKVVAPADLMLQDAVEAVA